MEKGLGRSRVMYQNNQHSQLLPYKKGTMYTRRLVTYKHSCSLHLHINGHFICFLSPFSFLRAHPIRQQHRLQSLWSSPNLVWFDLTYFSQYDVTQTRPANISHVKFDVEQKAV